MQKYSQKPSAWKTTFVASLLPCCNGQTEKDCLHACAKLNQFDWFVRYSMPTTEEARSKGLLLLPPEIWDSVFKLRQMHGRIRSFVVCQVQLCKQRPDKNFITCIEFYQMSAQQSHVQQHKDHYCLQIFAFCSYCHATDRRQHCNDIQHYPCILPPCSLISNFVSKSNTYSCYPKF